MKSAGTRKKRLPADFPRTRAEWDKAVARAPKAAPYDPVADPYDPNDSAAVAAFWKDAVVTSGGGPEAVRKALAARRGRGPGRKPAKTLVSLRVAPETLARWKASGPGWQTRMAELLRRRAP